MEEQPQRTPSTGTAATPAAPRRTGRVLGAAGLTLALGVGAAACGAGGAGSSGARATGGATRAAATRAPSAAAPVRVGGVPGDAELQSALLTAKDIGLSAMARPSGTASGGTSVVSGCAPLTQLLGGTSAARPADPTDTAAGADSGVRAEQDAGFAGSGTGPFVGEALTAEAPGRLAPDYAQARRALTACRTVTFGVGGTRLTFDLTPKGFGDTGSSGARLDGSLQGIAITGYLAVRRVGPAILSYYYFQLAGGSPQPASAYYRQAEAKAVRVLGAQAS